MTTRLRYAWIPIVTASALALTACGGEDDTGGQDATDVQGTYARRPARSAERAGQHVRGRGGQRLRRRRERPAVDVRPRRRQRLVPDRAGVRRPGHPPAVGVGARGGVGQRLRVRRPGADRGRPRRPHRVGRPARRRRRAAGPGGRHRARGRGRGAAVGQPDPGRGPLGQHGRGQPHRPGEGLAGVAGRVAAPRRHRLGGQLRRPGRAAAPADPGLRERARAGLGRRPLPARQHQPGRRSVAGLRAGPVGVPSRRHQRRGALLRRRGQRRHDRPRGRSPPASRRPGARASTSSPSATGWATTTTT